MENAPNKTNSENSNVENSDNKWDELLKFEEQVKAFREARDTVRFNELLEDRSKRLAWKDSKGPSTGASEESRLDALLESAPDNPVELEPETFEPIPEEDAKLLLDNEKEPEPEKEEETFEPIPEDDVKMLLDNEKEDESKESDLPPAEELDKAKKHQAIELNQLEHQNIAKHQEDIQEKERAMRTPLMAINAANKAIGQSIKQENLIPADQKLTEDVEYAIKKYAEYKVWLGDRKSTIDDQFKRDMKKVVQKAIDEGRISPDIEKTDYLDNYLNTAKEAADRFIEVQKEVKNGKEREAALNDIMDGFQVYDVKESAPINEPAFESPVIIPMPSKKDKETKEVVASSEVDNFDEWNEQILAEINSAKDLIGGYEGIAILTDPSPLSPLTSGHYSEWWSNLPEKGKNAVLNILDKIDSSDHRHDLNWGNSFRTWFAARVEKEPKLEAA